MPLRNRDLVNAYMQNAHKNTLDVQTNSFQFHPAKTQNIPIYGVFRAAPIPAPIAPISGGFFILREANHEGP